MKTRTLVLASLVGVILAGAVFSLFLLERRFAQRQHIVTYRDGCQCTGNGDFNSLLVFTSIAFSIVPTSDLGSLELWVDGERRDLDRIRCDDLVRKLELDPIGQAITGEESFLGWCQTSDGRAQLVRIDCKSSKIIGTKLSVDTLAQAPVHRVAFVLNGKQLSLPVQKAEMDLLLGPPKYVSSYRLFP